MWQGSSHRVHVLIVGGSRADRLQAALAQSESSGVPPSSRCRMNPETLPFLGSDVMPLPGSPRLIQIDDVEAAFPNNQQGGIRLVLTQSTYTIQRWIDRLGSGGRIVATADETRLEQRAPEAFVKRGPWRFFTIITLPAQATRPIVEANVERAAAGESPVAVARALADAFQIPSSDERVILCRRVFAAAPESAVAALALASAHRECQDFAGARGALDAALLLEPNWEAVHFEDGKFWLGCDDMERARQGFQRAADLMPTFSAAFGNLGATLGELDRTEDAAAALAHAVAHDPESFAVWNNVGVVNRELGRLEESEDALFRVVALAPEFVFGHYNLGHTRFLRGNYAGALAAYEEGQSRDPSKNRRQAARLALVRFANGDFDRAERELWRSVDAASLEERHDLLLEAYEIAQALAEAHPALASQHEFLERIEAALTP